MYKMAAVDIDGTISSRDNAVSKRVVETIRRTVEKGIPVCVCTGRNYGHAKPVIDQLGVDAPFTTIDGLVTFSSAHGRPIYENKLARETLLDIATIANQEGVYIEAVENEYYNKFVVNATDFDYGKANVNGVWWVNPLSRYYDTFEAFLNVVPLTYEFIFGGPERNVQKVRERIEREYGDNVGIRHSLWEGYIFVAAPQSGKAFGIRRLCEQYGFDMSEVVAIGDDLNDLDMLEQAGMGVAMGNAVPRAKAAANYVTDTIGNDGAALALEKFFP